MSNSKNFKKMRNSEKKVIELFIRIRKIQFREEYLSKFETFQKARENTFEKNENWKPSKKSSKQTDCSFDNLQTFNENMSG